MMCCQEVNKYMQGNVTYKIPGEEERNMVNGRQKQKKHSCLNFLKSCCCLDGKARVNMGFMKRNSEILKMGIL